jgi:hypothetical protein
MAKSQTLSGIWGVVSVAALDVAHTVKRRMTSHFADNVCEIQSSLDWPDAVWPMSEYSKDFSDGVWKIAG